MANVISCPKCERQLRVPDDLIGQSVKCPSCNETFTAALSKKEPPISNAPSKATPRPRDDDDERPSRRRPVRRDDDDDDDDRDRGSRRRHLAPHRGDMIQIMGILAFLPVMGFPFILGPISWVMGNTDLAEMDAGRMDPAGRKATETGRMCGKIAVLIYGGLFVGGLMLWMTCCCINFAFVGASGGR